MESIHAILFKNTYTTISNNGSIQIRPDVKYHYLKSVNVFNPCYKLVGIIDSFFLLQISNKDKEILSTWFDVMQIVSGRVRS